MSQALIKYIQGYCKQYRITCALFAKRKDPRLVPIRRLLWQLDPQEHKLVNCDMRAMQLLNAELYHLSAAGWALSKYPQMTSAEALTIGAFLFMLNDIAESYTVAHGVSIDPKGTDLTVYAQSLFPRFDKLISDTLLVGKCFYMPNVKRLELEGYSVHLSTDGRVFRVYTNTGFIQLEIVS